MLVEKKNGKKRTEKLIIFLFLFKFKAHNKDFKLKNFLVLAFLDILHYGANMPCLQIFTIKTKIAFE